MELVKRILSSPAVRKKESKNNISPNEQNVYHKYNRLSDSNFKYFGLPLAEVTAREGSTVPQLIKDTSQFLVEYGLEHEGIFRINGNVRLVDQLRTAIDENHKVALTLENYDVMTVASLLKLYLRELPEPIIPNGMFSSFVELQAANSVSSTTLYQNLHQLVEQLPTPNRDTLKHVIGLLVIVSKKENVNKMSANSMGIVFGPNIFSSEVRNQALTNQLVTNFIRGYDYIFRLPGELYSTSSSFTPNQKIKPAPSPPVKLDNGPLILEATKYNNRMKTEFRESDSWCNSSISNELLTASMALQDIHSDSLDANEYNQPSSIKNQDFIDGEISSVILEHLIGDLNSMEPAGTQSKFRKRIYEKEKLDSSKNASPRSKSDIESSLILEPFDNSSDSIKQFETQNSKLNQDSIDKEMRSLAKYINSYKKKIHIFEDQFEEENGIKPSKRDKVSNPEVKNCILELSKARTKLKNLKKQSVQSNITNSCSPSHDITDDESTSNPSEKTESSSTKNSNFFDNISNKYANRSSATRPNFSKNPNLLVDVCDGSEINKFYCENTSLNKGFNENPSYVDDHTNFLDTNLVNSSLNINAISNYQNDLDNLDFNNDIGTDCKDKRHSSNISDYKSIGANSLSNSLKQSSDIKYSEINNSPTYDLKAKIIPKALNNQQCNSLFVDPGNTDHIDDSCIDLKNDSKNIDSSSKSDFKDVAAVKMVWNNKNRISLLENIGDDLLNTVDTKSTDYLVSVNSESIKSDYHIKKKSKADEKLKTIKSGTANSNDVESVTPKDKIGMNIVDKRLLSTIKINDDLNMNEISSKDLNTSDMNKTLSRTTRLSNQHNTEKVCSQKSEKNEHSGIISEDKLRLTNMKRTIEQIMLDLSMPPDLGGSELQNVEVVARQKLKIQKALLDFEGTFGRPNGSDEKHAVKPLYDRYRNIKQLLATPAGQNNNSLSMPTEQIEEKICATPKSTNPNHTTSLLTIDIHKRSKLKSPRQTSPQQKDLIKDNLLSPAVETEMRSPSKRNSSSTLNKSLKHNQNDAFIETKRLSTRLENESKKKKVPTATLR